LSPSGWQRFSPTTGPAISRRSQDDRSTLIGVPSSAGSHGIGQEQAPVQLRRSGLVERLLAAGIEVIDEGISRWRCTGRAARTGTSRTSTRWSRSQFAVLGAIFIALEILVDGAVGLTAGRLGNLLSRRRRARQAMDVGSGTIMVALAGRLALER